MGVEIWVPLSESTRAALDRLAERSPVIGDSPLFRAQRGGRPWTRHQAKKLLHRAERLAGLAPLDGGDFYPYRRAWATARKHLPVQDVMKAGGWRDIATLQQCYQQSDEVTLLAVVTDPTKLREASNNG